VKLASEEQGKIAIFLNKGRGRDKKLMPHSGQWPQKPADIQENSKSFLNVKLCPTV